MNYELAKELQDAGFPQDIDNGQQGYCTAEACCNHELHLLHNDNDEGGIVGNNYFHGSWNELPSGRFIKAPTLSELIEACGEGFERLHFMKIMEVTTWVAYSRERPNELNITAYLVQQGDTPEEAVARLWLAINKK